VESFKFSKMKQYMALLGAAMFFVACFSLYLMLESVSLGARTGVFDVSHRRLELSVIVVGMAVTPMLDYNLFYSLFE